MFNSLSLKIVFFDANKKQFTRGKWMLGVPNTIILGISFLELEFLNSSAEAFYFLYLSFIEDKKLFFRSRWLLSNDKREFLNVYKDNFRILLSSNKEDLFFDHFNKKFCDAQVYVQDDKVLML